MKYICIKTCELLNQHYEYNMLVDNSCWLINLILSVAMNRTISTDVIKYININVWIETDFMYNSKSLYIFNLYYTSLL